MQTGNGRQGQTDNRTDKKHIQSDGIREKGGDMISGSVGKLLNPIKLPRALRARFARAQRPGRQEIDGYRNVREEEKDRKGVRTR